MSEEKAGSQIGLYSNRHAAYVAGLIKSDDRCVGGFIRPSTVYEKPDGSYCLTTNVTAPANVQAYKEQWGDVIDHGPVGRCLIAHNARSEMVMLLDQMKLAKAYLEVA